MFSFRDEHNCLNDAYLTCC